MIQESHLLREDAARFANRLYHRIVFSAAPTKTKGVMIVCRRKLKFDLIGSWTDKEGRLAIAKIRLDGQNIALISAYAPNTFEAGFYDLYPLRDLTGFRLVMGADFNAIWDSNMDRTGGAESRDQRLASDALRQWAAQTNMIDIWRVKNPSIKDYSFFLRYT